MFKNESRTQRKYFIMGSTKEAEPMLICIYLSIFLPRLSVLCTSQAYSLTLTNAEGQIPRGLGLMLEFGVHKIGSWGGKMDVN